MSANAGTGVLDPCICRVSVRKVRLFFTLLTQTKELLLCDYLTHVKAFGTPSYATFQQD